MRTQLNERYCVAIERGCFYVRLLGVSLYIGRKHLFYSDKRVVEFKVSF